MHILSCILIYVLVINAVGRHRVRDVTYIDGCKRQEERQAADEKMTGLINFMKENNDKEETNFKEVERAFTELKVQNERKKLGKNDIDFYEIEMNEEFDKLKESMSKTITNESNNRWIRAEIKTKNVCSCDVRHGFLEEFGRKMKLEHLSKKLEREKNFYFWELRKKYDLERKSQKRVTFQSRLY